MYHRCLKIAIVYISKVNLCECTDNIYGSSPGSETFRTGKVIKMKNCFVLQRNCTASTLVSYDWKDITQNYYWY